MTGEYHCVNETCRTFAEWYQNGKGMCETMWGNFFQYDADNENCMVMTFTGNNSNANVTNNPTVKVMTDTSGAAGVLQWQRSFLFSLQPYHIFFSSSEETIGRVDEMVTCVEWRTS